MAPETERWHTTPRSKTLKREKRVSGSWGRAAGLLPRVQAVATATVPSANRGPREASSPGSGANGPTLDGMAVVAPPILAPPRPAARSWGAGSPPGAPFPHPSSGVEPCHEAGGGLNEMTHTEGSYSPHPTPTPPLSSIPGRPDALRESPTGHACLGSLLSCFGL